MWLEPLLLGGDRMILRYHKLKFNPKYIISNKGFVISLVRKFHLLNIRRDKNGYVHYYIRDLSAGKRKDFKAHRLVAEYFIDNPNDYPIVNHIDGNKANNSYKNLEWCTNQENIDHSNRMGLNPHRNLVIRKDRKLSDEQKKNLSKICTGRKVSDENIIGQCNINEEINTLKSGIFEKEEIK